MAESFFKRIARVFTIKNFTRLFACFLFLLPWQAHYRVSERFLFGKLWQYGTISIYALDLAAVLVLFFAAGVLVRERKKNISSYPAGDWFSQLSLALILTALIPLSWSTFPDVFLLWWIRFSVGVGLVWIASLLLAETRLLWHALFAAGVLQSFLSLLQFAQQRVFGSVWLGVSAQDPGTLGVSVIETGAGRFLRSYGTFPHPNILAGFLAVLFASSCHLFFRHIQEKKLRALYGGCALIFFSGLWLTFSRAGLLAALLGAGFAAALFVFEYKRKAMRTSAVFWFAAWCLAALLMTMMSADLWITRARHESRLEQVSLQSRENGFLAAGKLLPAYHFSGVGFGHFSWAAQTPMQKDGIEPVHEMFLLALTEGGGVFFLIFMMWILYLFGGCIRSPAVGVVLIPVFFIGFLDHFWFSLPTGLWMFFAFFALAVSMKNHSSFEL